MSANRSILLSHNNWGSLTHETPVSEPEEAGQRVEGDRRARALSVVVRAGELGTGGREATAGDEVGGHSGTESGGGVHLGRLAGIDMELMSKTNLEVRTESKRCRETSRWEESRSGTMQLERPSGSPFSRDSAPLGKVLPRFPRLEFPPNQMQKEEL
jgi:hypothetical protein